MSRTAFFLLFVGALHAQSPGQPEFERHCALCHGMNGTGGRGPALTKAFEPEKLKKTIHDGREPEMPAFWFLTDPDIDKIAAYVTSFSKIQQEPVPGDPQHGAEVYKSSGCATCHTVEGQGNGWGPDLTGIGARRNAAHLKESLTNPAAALPENFLLVEAKTSDRTIQGIRVNEDSFTIQIKDIAGRYYSLRKSDIAQLEKKRGQSPMPPYKGQELQDLIAYLASLK